MEYWKKASILLGFGSFTDVIDFAVLYTALTLLIPVLGLGPYEMALIFSIPTYVGLGGSVVSGPLVDKFGRKKMWIFGNLLAGFAYLFGVWLCRSWFDLVIIRCVGVLGQGITLITYFTWLPEIIPPERRQTAMGLVGMLNTAASISLSGLLALTGIFPWLGWQHFFAYAALLDIIVVIIGIFVFKESEMWLQRKKMRSEGVEEGAKVEKRLSYKALFSQQWRGKLVVGLLIGLIYSMFGIITASGNAYGTHFTVTVMQYPPWLIGVLGIIGYPIALFYRPFIGYVSDKLGRLKNLLLFSVIGIPAAILYAYTPVLIGVGPQLHVIVWAMLWGSISAFGGSAQEDTGKLVLSENIPTTARASAHGLLELIKGIVLGSIGLVIAPIYAMNPSLGIAFSPLIGFVLGIIIVFIAMRMGMESKGRRLEEL
jgi:MFS family permease